MKLFFLRMQIDDKLFFLLIMNAKDTSWISFQWHKAPKSNLEELEHQAKE